MQPIKVWLSSWNLRVIEINNYIRFGVSNKRRNRGINSIANISKLFVFSKILTNLFCCNNWIPTENYYIDNSKERSFFKKSKKNQQSSNPKTYWIVPIIYENNINTYLYNNFNFSKLYPIVCNIPFSLSMIRFYSR